MLILENGTAIDLQAIEAVVPSGYGDKCRVYTRNTTLDVKGYDELMRALQGNVTGHTFTQE